MRRNALFGIVCACSLAAGAVQADPTAAAQLAPASTVAPGPRSVRQASLYADTNARSVGDILTVAIIERSSASNNTRISTSRNTKLDAKGGPGTGALDFIPDFGMSAETSRDHQGTGELSREGRLTARMAVTVTEVKPNGDLVIAGEREVQVNDEKDLLQLSGVVRPIDIRDGNVVFSTDIANAKILSRGKGQITNGTKPNLFARLLGWLF